jgi:DNA-binding NtrC family response regulator
VLVEGTGAVTIARRLHDLTYRDSNAPLVEVDCTWLPTGDVGRLLFGAESAGTIYRGFIEQANRGTLLLDDVAELPASEQARLVTLLDSRCFRRQRGRRNVAVKMRIVASVREPAHRLVNSGRLRRDLYARLCVFPIVLV